MAFDNKTPAANRFFAGQGSTPLIILSVLLIFCLSFLGLLQSINNYFFEAFPQYFSTKNNTQVVTVVVNDDTWKSDTDVATVVAKIKAFAPKDILLLQDNPTQLSNIASADVKIAAIATNRIVNNQQVALSIHNGFDMTNYVGAAIPPPLDNGIIRSATLSYSSQTEKPLESFLHHFAKQPMTTDTFRINFDKVSPFIMEVTSEQLLNNQVTQQLFVNKTVVLGQGSLAAQSFISTPLQHSGIGLSLLQFHALSLDAVLSNSTIAPLGLVGRLVVIALSFMVILLIIQKQSLRSNIFILFFIISLGISAITILSHLLEVILPITEFALTTLMAYWVYFHGLQNQMVKESNKLSNTVRNELSSTKQQLSFNEAEKPWIEITSLVQQYLLLTKTIFLEKVPKDHRVKEIQALNCSLDDIKEMRRDYEREPYSSALKENSPVEINRPYFNNCNDNEREFIVPLVFAGEVLGFWAMTIEPSQDWNENKFLQNVQSFAEQIAYLLHHRQAFQAENELNNSVVQQGLSFLSAGQPSEALKFNVHSSLKKLSLYQSMFNTMHSSSIIYDLFGRVIEANKTIEEIANRCNLNIFSLNALELLHNITSIDRDIIRSKLRSVILTQQASSFTSTSQLDGHTYIISVTAVTADKNKTANIVESEHPFSVLGLLVEFVDVGSMQQSMSVERKINDLHLSHINSALSTIQICQLELAESPLAEHDSTQATLALIQKQLDNAAQQTQKNKAVLQRLSDPKFASAKPVDILNVFNTVKAKVQAKTIEKNITLEVDLPELSTIVTADNNELLIMIKLMMSMLIEDAQLDSSLRVKGKYKEVNGQRLFYLSLSNRGFGIPKEHLMQMGSSSFIADASSEITLLKQTFESAHAWNARPRVYSRLGKGLRFSLILSGI